jgi:murein DD-endopeptidase MepM/ murein hydrolase activator NlpD
MAANSLSALTQQVEKLLGLLKQVDIYAAAGGGSGGGGVMPNSLAKVSSQAPGFFGTIGKAMGGMGAVAGGVSQMMPDTAETIGREGSIYGAGVSSGGIIRRGVLERTLRLGLGEFQSFAGADAVVGGMLAGRGMVPGGAAFSRTVTEVGQANRYLNMDNLTAARAFEGFTSGPTSGNLLRNFGVFTSDLNTGEVLSQNQIFQQIKNRMVGRTPTVAGTMESLRRGFLGDNLRGSGLDAEQQSILSSQFIANAMGVNLDFADPKSVDKVNEMLKEQGYENPFLSQYKLASKDSELMEAATEPYIAGVKGATDQLIRLKDFTKDELIPAFGELKAFLDTFAGSNTGQGFGAAVVGGAVAGGALLGGAARNMFAGNAVGNVRQTGPSSAIYTSGPNKGQKIRGKNNIAAAQQANRKAGLRGGFKTGGLLGLGMAAFGAYDAMVNGQPAGGAIGNAVGTIGGSVIGGALGSFLGPVGTFAGSMIGGYFGGMAGQAVGSMFDQNTNGATGGDGNIDPGQAGASYTGAYGEPRPYGSGVHEGVDIPLPIGVEIKAVMDGVVQFSGNGKGGLSRGLYIEIAHGQGRVTLYSHLSTSFVSKGNVVAQGDVIGLSGNSGYSTGPHLHFGLYINGGHQNPNGLVGRAYGGGGNKKQFVPPTDADNPNGLTPQELASQMTSGGTSGSTSVSNNFTSGISGVHGGGGGAKAILESILGSPGGSLGAVASTSTSTALPEPISGDSAGMMGESNLGTSSANTSGSSDGGGAGGGYEPGGLKDVDYMSNSLDITRKVSGRGQGGNTNVTINLSIAQASESEAKKFAGMVKNLLEEEKMIDRMAGK